MDCKEICRLCAEHCSVHQLTPLDDPSRGIKSKLFRCSQIDLSLYDSFLLPRSVCSGCIENLENSWKFAEAVAKAQDKLQWMIEMDPLADIKTEEDNVEDSQIAVSTAFDNVIQYDDHKYASIGHDREHSNFTIECSLKPVTDDNTNTIKEYFDSIDVISSISSPKHNVTEDIPDLTEVQQSIDSSPNHHQHIQLHAETNQYTELLSMETFKSVAKNSKDLWSNVMKIFRNTLNITDEEFNKNGTIDERAHPELAFFSWNNYKWKCFECSKHFENVDKLESHVEIEHNTISCSMQYCCFDCDKKYGLVASLKNHIYLSHRPVLRFW